MKGLGGKLVVVTGGAGGIGSAISRRLAAEGCRIAVTDIDLAVAFFASEDAAYITGQTLSVSGGLTMA